MRKILLLLGMVFFASCEMDKCGCVIVDIGIQMSVTDSNGADLLNPANQGSFSPNDIKFFRDENGALKGSYFGAGGHSGDLEIFPVAGENYRLSVLTPGELNYIQWKTDMDTIRCEFSQTSDSKICTKVWYNSKLVYDSKNETERYFEIKK